MKKTTSTTDVGASPLVPTTTLTDTANHVALDASANSATIIARTGKQFGLEVDGLETVLAGLLKSANEIKQGDLSAFEEMLGAQAYALQSVFSALATRAFDTTYRDNLETYLRLALKAQSQCTRTIEVLGMLKNPTGVAFVRQANFGFNQQVNNNSARETKNQQNELLSTERKQYARMDSGGTGAPSGAHPDVAAVEAGHRSKNRPGQGYVGKKRV